VQVSDKYRASKQTRSATMRFLILSELHHCSFSLGIPLRDIPVYQMYNTLQASSMISSLGRSRD
jgi:hypothetical protein